MSSTQRQLDTITAALAAVLTLNGSEQIKQHLRLAILGTTEMAGYVCRWERYHPKALEAIANHRFSRSTITVETNLLSTSGRGTLPQRFKAAEKALRWMCARSYPVPHHSRALIGGPANRKGRSCCHRKLGASTANRRRSTSRFY